MRSKKALSPLVATVLLVVFALIIGTATMSWGKNYVGDIPGDKDTQVGSSYVISRDDVKDDPLKKLQISYIYGDIVLEEYLDREKEIVEKMRSEKD